MSGLLGVPIGGGGSGRARYAQAMALWRIGRLSDAQLEAYRSAAASDTEPPATELHRRGLPLPADPPPTPEGAIRALVDEIDHLLARLDGPGIAEVRSGLALWRGGAVTPGTHANLVVRAYLPAALRALDADDSALAGAIDGAAPLLCWQSYDAYAPGTIGAQFPHAHAFASLIGAEAAIPARDFDLGLFLIAPHVLYRDHCHPAPELYLPLTGPHGWRFGADRPLVIKPAFQPVWNPPMQPHLIKAGALPFLCLYAWTQDVAAVAEVIPATDWDALEDLRLE
ncbi:MAG: dimethylsulfonioproprionate lyase family protein [Pararhodobacter sp.]